MQHKARRVETKTQIEYESKEHETKLMPTLADLDTPSVPIKTEKDPQTALASASTASASRSLASLADVAVKHKIVALWPDGYKAQQCCIAWVEAFEPAAKISVCAPQGSCPLSIASKDLQDDAKVYIVFEAPFGSSNPSYAAAVTKHLKKLVWVMGAEDDAVLEAAFSAMPMNALFSQPSPKEIWLTPQSVPRAAALARMHSASTFRVMPQLWSKLPLHPDHQIFANIPGRDASVGYDIVIPTYFTSSEKSMLFPLLIAEAANRSKPDSIASVIVVLPEAVDSAALEANARQLDIGAKLSVVNAKEEEVVPFFLQRKKATVFLHHQHDRTEHPEILWHAAYCGFPVVHNLKTTMKVGMRYTDNDIATAARLMLVSKDSFNEAYMQRNREGLEAVFPKSVLSKVQEFCSQL